MSKKNRPAKAVNQNSAAPSPEPAPAVTHGNVFVAFLREAGSIANEVEARRQIERDVAEFFTLKGLTEEFNAWRKAKYTPAPLASGPAA